MQLSFASSPSGAEVTVNGATHTTPYQETFLQGSRLTITAAPTTGAGSTVAGFGSWSDGGARSHELSAPTTPTTYTATYTRPTASLTASPTSGAAPLAVTYTAGATNAPGVTGGFTFAWDLDNDGAFDDGSGTSKQATYADAGARTVRVLATDSRGATDTLSTIVGVGPATATLTVKATRRLAVVVDGERHKGGWSGHVVTGSTVHVVAPKRQLRRGVPWVFVRWSDGGARRHDVTVWDPDLTLKAIYRRRG